MGNDLSEQCTYIYEVSKAYNIHIWEAWRGNEISVHEMAQHIDPSSYNLPIKYDISSITWKDFKMLSHVLLEETFKLRIKLRRYGHYYKKETAHFPRIVELHISVVAMWRDFKKILRIYILVIFPINILFVISYSFFFFNI